MWPYYVPFGLSKISATILKQVEKGEGILSIRVTVPHILWVKMIKVLLLVLDLITLVMELMVKPTVISGHCHTSHQAMLKDVFTE